MRLLICILYRTDVMIFSWIISEAPTKWRDMSYSDPRTLKQFSIFIVVLHIFKFYVTKANQCILQNTLQKEANFRSRMGVLTTICKWDWRERERKREREREDETETEKEVMDDDECWVRKYNDDNFTNRDRTERTDKRTDKKKRKRQLRAAEIQTGGKSI